MDMGFDSDLQPAKVALMSDISEWIVGKETAESANIQKADNFLSTDHLKNHIRQLAIEKRKEIARNILKTESGVKVVNAIKTRIEYYIVSH